MVIPFNGQERFFIITAGRTGSSLLASIMAGAGADFGVSKAESWDESKGGAYEHPSIVRATRCFRASYNMSFQRPTGLSRWIWDAKRHFGKKYLHKALSTVRYVKAIDLDLTVQSAFKQGFFPRIIVNHRQFTAHAISLSQMFAHRSIEVLEADYLRSYGNALIQLQLYGGCVVDYDELTDPTENSWLTALSEVTSLPADALASVRQGRIRPRTPSNQFLPKVSARTEDLYHALQDLSGRVIPASNQALRNWRSKGLSV